MAVRAPSEPGRRVRLRVEIDEEAALSRLGKARGEVDRGGRLADAALLVRDRVDPGCHGVTVPAGPDASGSEQGALAVGLHHEPLLAGSQAAERGDGSGERALPRHARAAREPGRRRAGLADHEEAVRGVDGRARRSARPPARRGRARRTGRPRARPRRLRGRAGGTTRPPSAAVRAPSRPQHRTVSSGCSSARPQTTSRFGSSAVQRSRNSHFRRSASSSVTARSGSEAASGMPGVPPPDPTSTIGPSRRETSSTPASASSSRTRRASSGSRSPVRPGVATTAASHRSRSSLSRPSAAAGRRRSGSARRPRSPSPPRGRP